jgi:hypothetical protein
VRFPVSVCLPFAVSLGPPLPISCEMLPSHHRSVRWGTPPELPVHFDPRPPCAATLCCCRGAARGQAGPGVGTRVSTRYVCTTPRRSIWFRHSNPIPAHLAWA